VPEIGYFDLAGLRLRDDPARDACFRIVRRDAEMHGHDEASDVGRREIVHRHMSNEITSLEIAAQCLAEFPDAPWELRMELARQCWDEARHVLVLYRRLREIGGWKGEFPIATFEWSITSALDDLAARLATQNRTFEAGAMDVVRSLGKAFRDAGDTETGAVLDGILADEIQHVRFANRWIRRLASKDRRILLKIAVAVRFVAEVNALLAPRTGELNAVGVPLRDPLATIPAVNVEDRRLAGFSDEEIGEILRQAGFRALVEDAAEGAR